MSEKFVFTAISDVHITDFHAGEEDFVRAMQVMSEKYPADLYVFPGDIVYQLDSWSDSTCRSLHEACYDFVSEQLDKYIPAGTPRIMVVGNHEYPQNNTDPVMSDEALAIWQRKFGQKPIAHEVHGGYHFIKSPLYSWRMEPSVSTEKIVMAEIDAALAADPDKPVFYLTHVPMMNTVAFTQHEVSFTPEFREFLTKRPRVIHISGHLHVHILDERCIYQEGFTSVTLPCNAVGYTSIAKADHTKPRVNGMSACLQFEVEGTKVTVHRIDCTTGKEYGKPWVIDVADTVKGIQPYGKERVVKEPRPEFACDAALDAKVEGTTAEIIIGQKFVGEPALYYAVTLTGTDGSRVDRLICSDFWRLVHDEPMADTVSLVIADLKPDFYEAKAVPMNGVFGEGDRPIRCHFAVV